MDGREPVAAPHAAFVLAVSVSAPLTVPFALWGSGQMYVHYMTDVLGTSLTIPSGRDSVMMSVFPIAGGPDRTVELQLEYDQPPASGPLPAPPLWATMTLRGEVTSNEFRVLASSPQSGGNMGSVTLSIAGTGFSESTTVALSGGGSESLVPSHTEVNSTGTVVKATFDMAGQPTGARHVTVADGSNETVLANAFRVDAAIFPKVHVQMLAPPRVPRYNTDTTRPAEPGGLRLLHSDALRMPGPFRPPSYKKQCLTRQVRTCLPLDSTAHLIDVNASKGVLFFKDGKPGHPK